MSKVLSQRVDSGTSENEAWHETLHRRASKSRWLEVSRLDRPKPPPNSAEDVQVMGSNGGKARNDTVRTMPGREANMIK